MIIDKELPTVKANETDNHIMNLCDETQWIKFIDLNSAKDTILDFRNASDLKAFLPSHTISSFIRLCQMARLKELRIHRMNLLRHSLKSYSKQWNVIGNIYKSNRHQRHYSEPFSEYFLKSYKRMKLVAVKYIR